MKFKPGKKHWWQYQMPPLILYLLLPCSISQNAGKTAVLSVLPTTGYLNLVKHSGQKCLPRVACLWSKVPMFQGAGMNKGGELSPLAFQYLILMIWRHCDLNLVMISLLASNCQDFKVGMPVFQPFYDMKLKTSNFKVLAFCIQWRYHDQIQITRSSYHKNQILKC